MRGKYEDIMELPHHTSERRARMSILDRAAQFSPFAALTGYDAAIDEVARLTESKIELIEEEKLILNDKLREAVEKGAKVCIAYFIPDNRKTGGMYANAAGLVKRIDYIIGTVLMGDGVLIPVENIVSITY